MVVRFVEGDFPAWRQFYTRSDSDIAMSGTIVCNAVELAAEVAGLAKMVADMPVRFGNGENFTIDLSIPDTHNRRDYRSTVAATWCDSNGELWTGTSFGVTPEYFKTFITGMTDPASGNVKIVVVDRLKPLRIDLTDRTTGRVQFRILMPVRLAG